MVNQPLNKFYVLKRGGRKEEVFIDKITSRIEKLCYGLNVDYVDPVSITLKVVSGLYPGVTTAELDALAAETAATLSADHPDYATLAARIAISNLHKETKKQFSDVVYDLYHVFDEQTEKKLISDEHYNIVMQNAECLNSCIIYDRDFSYDYFAFKELENFYLLRIKGKVVERPQHMLMRVAVGIHGDKIDDVISTYNLLSERFYLHSTDTLLFAGTPTPQLCSSISIMMPDDSIEGIFNCIRFCGILSKYTGTVGLNVQNIRAKGTYIAGTNGVSNGLIPMLRVFNNMACFIDQMITKKPSEITVYIEPWHADILEFLNLSKPGGKEEVRTRDLSYALWVPDLFMKRVESDSKWSLMCPHLSPGLTDCYGEEFEELYEKFEAEGRFINQISARDLWKAIIVLQAETGGPVMMYKDTCNRKSNQKKVGILKGGNYKGEVVAYTSPEEIVSCPQASISLTMFVSTDRKTFDFQKLKDITKVVTKNLDKIIDVNFYPLSQCKTSILTHRTIGVSVQGLADTCILLRMPFDSEEAKTLNKQIFETVYYGALEASSELAEVNGSYSTFNDSPASKGILQFDMWNVVPSELWNWESLKEKIKKTGIRNSLLVAQMSTPILSRLFGNSESTDLYRSYLYTRRVSSGEFSVVNQLLIRDLNEKDIWDDKIKEMIVKNSGSIQSIPEIPDDLKAIYKTIWEIPQKVVISLAVDRGAFIDQSQSVNIHMLNPNYGSLSSMHFYGWKNGLKTGMSRLRTKSSPKNYQKVVENGKVNDSVKEDDLEEVKAELQEKEEKNLDSLVCSLQNREGCEMCGA